MKKLIIGLAILLTAVSAVSCTVFPGSTEATSPPAATEETQAHEPTKLLKDFTVISQMPELPTGCEITCLAMALNYYGIPADKCDLADNYLEKSEDTEGDFRKAFVGNPRDENSYGCYAPVIENAANNYLLDIGSSMLAVDLSGTELDRLVGYIDIGVPVIIWGTMDCLEGTYTDSWEVDGETLTWYWPEHVMVMIGYSDDYIWVADPMKGKTQVFERELFNTRYEELQRQAVVVQYS